MIKSISLKNFRKHRDLTVNFSDGITVVRADNEAGKSSLFEAIMYTLFGIKACRNSDIATWGESPSSCKVTLVFEVDGREITVTRSPRSAEVITEGRRVSGQNEVSRFCESMLDIKQGIGSKLMFASQGDMRGILEDTGGSSIKLIEQLTGLEDIDTWVDTLQTHFNTGRTEVVEQMLHESNRRLEEAQAKLSDVGDPTVKANNLRLELTDQYRGLKHKLEVIGAEKEKLSEQYETAQADYNAYQDTLYKIRETQANLNALQRLLTASVPEEVDETPLETTVTRLKSQIALVEDYSTLEHYQPDGFFDGSRQNLIDQVLSTGIELEAAMSEVERLSSELKVAKSKMVYSLECPTCHRAWDDLEQREIHNKEQEVEIAELTLQLEAAEAELLKIKEVHNRLCKLRDYPVPTIKDGSNWVSDGANVYPPRFVWVGERPTGVSRQQLVEAEQNLLRAKSQNGLRSSTMTSVAKALSDQKMFNEQLDGLKAGLPDKEPESPTALAVRLQDLKRDFQEANHTFNEVQRKLNDLKAHTAVFYEEYEQAQQQVVQATAEVRQAEETLEDYLLNNSLLKYLRSAKPHITDKVWQSVCSLTSKYFSMMRGITSSVYKSSSGFEVDGNNVQSLSGSTLDVLGIATRVALLKTFVPSCKMMFLDEPFAACDEQRQSQVLAFLCSTGFEQVVIVTHEDTTEAVADNLIAI